MASDPEVTVIRRLSFEAPHPAGGQERHPYVLEASVTGPLDPETGYVIDFDVLKALMREIVGGLDMPLPAEAVVLACWRELAPRVRPARLTGVRLWETPNQGAEYHGD
jgi:6-pyruvoyltetrahydropterin/6-carboxytetrahydropterin synthase